MCGIFGIIVASESQIDCSVLRRAVKRMFKLSEARGKDSSGVFSVLQREIAVYKLPQRASALLKTSQYAEIIASAVSNYQRGSPFVVAGHTRMVTNGTEEDDNNNQPVIKNGHVLLHNGIIVNDNELWESRPDLAREYAVDTEVFGALLAQSRRNGGSFSEAFVSTFLSVRGANTVAAFGVGDESLLVGTTNGSMYYWRNRYSSITIFGSERTIVERVVDLVASDAYSEREQIVHLKSKQYMTIGLATSSVQELNMSIPAVSHSRARRDTPGRLTAETVRRIRLLDRRKDRSGGRIPANNASNDWKTIGQLMQLDLESINALRRCTTCLLPETFPFISFNEKGVCQFCLDHNPHDLIDMGALRVLASNTRRSTGRPDCLVPISGGRDSCYGLHYVKKVLGLNPIAYTYDWGFVTDLARRNISRICEHLEVEHVLVAADIRKKRENVRKNVVAWLHRPQLGMIPLFMAGDKMFFYFASMIRKQLNLGPIFFSMNWLEKTDFKVGFAGVKDSAIHDKTYGLDGLNKAKLLTYYVGEFVRNPRYMNGSLGDTAFAFLSYYLQRKDYYSLFDYLPWNQSEIEQTIIGEYDWEVSPDSHSTWRIGDGTAPFYNYIYFTVAGFSEHDTFRSNQIRAGMIAREEARELVERENRPRIESFKWYCDTVGLDAIAALKVINAIPKLYPIRR